MSNLSLRERDVATIAQIGKLRFSPVSVIGRKGNRLIEEGGRFLVDLSGRPAIVDRPNADVGVSKVWDAGTAVICFRSDAVSASFRRMRRCHHRQTPQAMDSKRFLPDLVLQVSPSKARSRTHWSHIL
ncbi:hypothetical protein LB561_21475 [Mesorhizobium sp. B292B1B]|uniref:hypothetical protein n=1 Tax=unclassified Mesorhizobium TaxID=325217 RepID=UPI001CD05021|nr:MULTISPECIES: hypothetical protein [unclassified Mesorhizobium]MCA0013434.1 hypothetical protein [Mesorhizobium sp. B294B1A1]MCA0039851.1 hypothetical protein [Mesorhizobium sp. B292B1B]